MGIGSLTHKDLAPIAILSSEFVVFGVNASSELRSGRDLVSLLRADPARLNIGIATALGGASHIAVAQTMKAAGVDVQRLHFIVYASSAEAVTALLGNHLDLVAASAGNFLPVLSSGRVRTLAITSPQRVRGVFAEIPTWTEQNVNAVFSAWRGLAGPPGMTPAQRRFWDDTIRRMVQSKDWAELLERTHEQSSYMNSADAASFLDAQQRDLGRTIVELGLAK
jgi:putative tricarboxylic transport membrane protein